MTCSRCIHKNVCSVEVVYDIHNCADFFELVRCKDCKFYREVMKDCTHKFGMVKAKPNDFCNYGERKETE